MDLLIDGYNLMHSAGLARLTYGPGDLQRSRHRLAVLVSRGFSTGELARITIVFDAKGAPDNAGQEAIDHGVKVLFAAQGCEADDVIEELIERHYAPKNLRVVSGDHRLQRAARRRQAAFIGSDDFLAELHRRIALRQVESTRRPAGDARKESGVTSGAELDQWLNEFQDVEVDSIVTDVEQALVRQAQRELERQLEEQARRSAPPPAGASSSPKPKESEGSPASPLPPDEAEFWERRIQELYDEEEWG